LSAAYLWLPHNLRCAQVSVRRNKPLRGVLSSRVTLRSAFAPAGEGTIVLAPKIVSLDQLYISMVYGRFHVEAIEARLFYALQLDWDDGQDADEFKLQSLRSLATG
jgi:hypothetical protein